MPKFLNPGTEFKVGMKTKLLKEVYEEVTGKRLDLESFKLNIDFHVYGGEIKLLDDQIKAILKSRKRKGELDISNKEINKVAERFLHKFKEY